MTETAFCDWLRETHPIVAVGIDYCTTLEEMRLALNEATGLVIEQDHDAESAFDEWRSALELNISGNRPLR